MELNKHKCGKCLFYANDPLEAPHLYPCDICKDRPNRDKDKSWFVVDFTDEQKAEQNRKALEEEKRQGKFDY